MRVNSFHPTTNQKTVIAKIIASPTATVASQEIAANANMVAARNQLMKLGLITVSGDEVALTQQGQQVAADEYIIDETGQLSPEGQALAYGDQEQEPEQQSPMESYSLLRELLRINEAKS